MMTTLAAAASLQAPPPAPEVHAAPRPGGAHPFAELLRQNQAPAAPAAAPAPPSAAADESEAPGPADAGKPPPTQKARARVAAPASQRPVESEAKDKVDSTAAEAKPAERSASDDTATDPALAQFLADLHLPPTAKAEAAGAKDTATDPSAEVDVDPTGRGVAARAADARAAAADARQQIAEKEQTTRATFDAAGLVLQDKLAAAEAASPHERAAGDGGANRIEPGTSPTVLVGAPLLPTATGLAAAQVPLDVAVPTPLNAPDFARALGAQVSVLAKDGVQRAELHLNPAEMGPVSVQIVMDGTQARVDFGSDVAATRHALEAGLPELASALRDAGLTLSGGGVSQHSRGRSDGDGDASQGGRKGGTDPMRSTDPVRPLQRLAIPGGVDLYA